MNSKICFLLPFFCFVGYQGMALEFIVKIDPALSVERFSAENSFDDNGFMVSDELLLPGGGALLLVDVGGQHHRQARNLLQSMVGVRQVNLNYPIELIQGHEVSSDSRFTCSGSWHLRNINVDYDNLENLKDVVVAVLDSGLYPHQNVDPKIWTNSSEIINGIDDDGNGYIDDINGWDFSDDDNDPDDTINHGMHVAGIIGALPSSENSKLHGVAPNAFILPLKIVGSNKAGFLFNAVKAIYYAVASGAKVLNNSWRIYSNWSGYDETLDDMDILVEAINHVYDSGSLYIAAAGNESVNLDKRKDPALIPLQLDGLENIISVSSHNRFNWKSYYSNFGSRTIHLSAPGEGVCSTVIGDGWGAQSGTSMASPVVSGMAALGFGIGLKHTEIRQALLGGGNKKAAGKHVIHGRVDGSFLKF